MVFRNDEMYSLDTIGKLKTFEETNLERDAYMAIGIAAGYINLTSSILGYSTGCCACFDSIEIAETISTKNPIKLLMGIGFKNEKINRRIHHKTGFVFPSKSKQEIQINYIK
jgi:hypothetical protein